MGTKSRASIYSPLSDYVARNFAQFASAVFDCLIARQPRFREHQLHELLLYSRFSFKFEHSVILKDSEALQLANERSDRLAKHN
jgi:hypothetical protein